MSNTDPDQKYGCAPGACEG